jgi:hypothetical protein
MWPLTGNETSRHERQSQDRMAKGKQIAEFVEESKLEAAESADALVVGTTQLFKDGQIRCIPTPTPNPKGLLQRAMNDEDAQSLIRIS